jgi:YidC/Oxa1 family membrane protein insertase
MSINADISEGIYFSGEGVKQDDYVQRLYNFGYNVRYQNDFKGDTLRVYIGPLDISELDYYDNHLDELVMNNGWYESMFRFISLIILQVLQFLQSIIPNYGIVIIIFSILVKVVLYPLTKKSYSSMKDMQKIQPLMAEIREKYKDDAQRMNSEMMKLYKEHGVNPLGGCLPMILQMPLLIALFIVFRSTIQLRGAMFIPGWITDLSRPDTIFTLPFSLPMYGNEFNILPILMALTMIFQSKMTMQDPKQKMMVYIMPIFMLLIFNRFPSGLNLYYTLFNLFTIVQQKFISKGSSKEPDIKQTKKIKGKK